MRILFLTESLHAQPRSWVDKLAHALARMAQREGHQVWVVAARSDAVSASLNAPIDTSRWAGDWRTGLLAGVPVLMPPQVLSGGAGAGAGEVLGAHWAEAKFDVAHALIQADGACQLLDLIAGQRLPTLVTLSGLPPTDSTRLAGLRQRLAMLASTIVVPSDFAANQWRSALPEQALRVLPHGVDLLALIHARPVPPASPAPYEHPTLLGVGTSDKQSGLDELLQAFAAVPRPELRLRLCCEGDFDSDNGQAISGRAASDLRVTLAFHSSQSSLTLLSAPCDLLCLPTLAPEAFSLLAHEAATLRLPCLASDVGAQAAALRGFGYAELLPAGDVAAWSSAIESWATRRADPSTSAPAPLLAPALSGKVPLRLEEEAFLYEALYRDLQFRSRT